MADRCLGTAFAWRSRGQRDRDAYPTREERKLSRSSEPVKTDEPSAFMSVTDVAESLGVKHQAVRRAISRGELPASKVCSRVRIARADFEAWVDGQRIEPEHFSEPSPPPPRPRHGLKRHLDVVAPSP